MEDLDLEYDKDFIIPRALFATGAETFEADITKLENLYPRAVILMELQQTDERISNEVCELVAKRYQVPIFYRWKFKDDKRVDISQIFPRYVFWDADPSNLDVDHDLSYIIHALCLQRMNIILKRLLSNWKTSIQGKRS